MSENASELPINQKEYLKKYLAIGKAPGEKKKKKKKKPSSTNVQIIDDDAIIHTEEKQPRRTVDDDIVFIDEDAPQIVAIIDERPPSMRIDEKTKNPLWQPIGTVSDGDHVEHKPMITSFKIEPKSNEKILTNFDRKKKRAKDDHSPARKDRQSRTDVSPFRDIVIKEERRSVSRSEEGSPPRSPSRSRRDDSSSPPRRNRSPPMADDYSPPRRKRDADEDASPPRRRRDAADDNSPPRRKADRDASPPRRKRNANEDASPPRRRRDDNSPPRRKADADASPPRRNRVSDDNSPPRRRNRNRETTRWDSSPPRKHTRRDEPASPRRKDRNKKNDTSPRRRKTDSKGHGSPSSPKKKKEDSRMDKTLDGKTAGLQNARDLIEETRSYHSREDNLFKSLSKDVSGENANTVHRNRQTGRIRNVEEEEERQRKKREEEEKNKEKYAKWGRGVAQVESREQQLKDELHEMSKPLARYADDEDLEKYLKQQEREGDPMLAYIRKKRRKKAEDAGEVFKPKFEGEFMPNRYGIRPGHRWDGVDRGNGYEKKWFEIQNEKKAQQEDIYKWSTEDM